MPFGSTPMTWSTRPAREAEDNPGSIRFTATKLVTWSVVRATRPLTGPAAIRLSITSGSFRSGQTCMDVLGTRADTAVITTGQDSPWRWTDLIVRHQGYVTRHSGLKSSTATPISSSAAWERPDDPFVCFNIGAIAVERQHLAEAWDFSRNSGQLGAERLDSAQAIRLDRPHTPDDGKFPGGDQDVFDGLKLDQQDAELWFRKGVVHRHRGESADAENAWRRILGLKRPNQFCSVDRASMAA